MLAGLTVKDIVLAETVAVEFGPGLNVLTGETGTGKSILLDALGLAAGGRGQGRATLRPGVAQGSASALFDTPMDHAARELLATRDIACDEAIVLRRTIAADGRTRAFINDEPVGVGFLKDVGSLLLEVHGQSDDRGLFDSSTHRALLDGFGGLEALAGEVRARFAELDRLLTVESALATEVEVARADAEYTRAAAGELQELNALPGEEQTLAAQRSLLANAARIAGELSAIGEAVDGERGAQPLLAAALKRFPRIGDEARRASAAAESALEQAFALLDDARRELDQLLDRLEVDGAEFERQEDRLHALRAAGRKYAVHPDQLARLREEFERRCEAIESGDDRLRAAGEDVAAARNAYLESAKALSQARNDAGRRLEKAVSAELAPLKLAHAKFRVALQPLTDGEASASGLERVAFEVATLEGAEFGALTRIASGGELARFSLAIKVVLAATSEPSALVFDEVDRGVGGAVADAVGNRLHRLSRRTQVLLVTHSPQVAAKADHHYRVTRTGDRVKVDVLGKDERIEEVARMLSGASVSAEARSAARRLIEDGNGPARRLRKRA
ncbi:MAG: DNA repair protein RecN, partial [Alphaproteobacteria bacterium]|nr:DNA repair protein RecN [Alphaproteobacteria bacterium]